MGAESAPIRLDSNIIKRTSEMFKRYLTLAGRTIMVRETACPTKKGPQKRKEKCNPTSDAVKKINIRIALRDLTAKINRNFGIGDSFVTLTHDDEDGISRAEARRRFKNFKRNLRNWHKRNGSALKAIDVEGSGRPHHHIVINNTPVEVLDNLWPYGFIRITPMDGSGEYSALAYYMLIKNAIPAAGEDDARKKKYSCTRTIITPDPKQKEIDAPLKDGEIIVPKEYKNKYYIAQDTIQTYEHPILGVHCIEYVLVLNENQPAQKKIYQGKLTKRERMYKDYEQQLSMDGLGY